MAEYTPEQIKANRAAWVAALLSGEYEQATGFLNTKEADGKERFCCLGVACDLAMKAGVELSKEKSKIGTFYAFWYGGWHNTNGELPTPVQEWLGMTEDPGCARIVHVPKYYPSKKHPEYKKEFCTLTELNDNGYTFEEIAAIIVEHDADLGKKSPSS